MQTSTRKAHQLYLIVFVLCACGAPVGGPSDGGGTGAASAGGGSGLGGSGGSAGAAGAAGAAGGDGGAGGAGGGSAASGGGAACEFPTVTRDVRLDRDLTVATVDATLSLNGGALPDSPNGTSRGALEVRTQAAGPVSVHRITLTASGPVAMRLPLFAGAYEVWLSTSADVTGMPRSTFARVATGVVQPGTTRLDWNAVTATASGTLTLNGGALPDSPALQSRGKLVFRDRRTFATHSVTLAPTGPATFSLLLFAGEYDVDLETAANVVGLPASTKTCVASGVAIASSASFAWDVRAVNLSGLITVNGGAMPASPNLAARGSVAFIDAVTSATRFAAVPATGPASWSALVFAGTYDIRFTSSRDAVGLPSGQGVQVEDDVAVTVSRSFTWNLEPVSIFGTLTLNGAALPDASGNRGSLQLGSEHGSVSFAIGPSGPATFSGLVYRGTYDAVFSGSLHVAGVPPNVYAVIARSVAVGAQQAFTWNIVAGVTPCSITVDGAPMPDSPLIASRGKLVLRSRDVSGSTEIALSPTGPATFSPVLYAGTYTALLITDEGAAGMPAGQSHVLSTGFTVPHAGPLRFDATTATVSGLLTVNGGAMPDSPLRPGRGSVRLRQRVPPAVGLNEVRAPMGPTGPGAWSVRVFGAAYDVDFVTATDVTGLPSSASTGLAEGCP